MLLALRRVMKPSYLAWLPCLALLLEGWAVSQTISGEQSSFNTNQAASEPLIKRPVRIPGAVLEILRKDDTVGACMEDNPVAPGQSLASWFVASEIHLHGPDEVDLVVLPAGRTETYMCFHSVEGVGWFWVFRHVGERYELALKTAGLSLRVLRTKHDGYRDIRAASEVGTLGRWVIFRFSVGQYRKYR